MSEFVEVKTADLVGAALDWAVGKAIGWVEPIFGIGQISYIVEDNFLMMGKPDPDEPDDVTRVEHFNHYTQWAPSRSWSQGGPLIDKYVQQLCDAVPPECGWGDRAPMHYANSDNADGYQRFAMGETKLIAACRAIV
ncbi:phage protein NinX family protein, partial [Pseudomonas syringae]